MLLHELLLLSDRLAPVLPWAAVLWSIVVWVAARGPGADWLGGLPPSLAAAALAALFGLMAMPGGTFVLVGEPVPGGFGASAARLSALALGLGFGAGAMAWPLAALRAARRAARPDLATRRAAPPGLDPRR